MQYFINPETGFWPKILVSAGFSWSANSNKTNKTCGFLDWGFHGDSGKT
jgi:hypothetical protein